MVILIRLATRLPDHEEQLIDASVVESDNDNVMSAANSWIMAVLTFPVIVNKKAKLSRQKEGHKKKGTDLYLFSYRWVGDYMVTFPSVGRKLTISVLGAIQVLRNALFLEIWPPPTLS